jgi:hypothetical protein
MALPTSGKTNNNKLIRFLWLELEGFTEAGGENAWTGGYSHGRHGTIGKGPGRKFQKGCMPVN